MSDAANSTEAVDALRADVEALKEAHDREIAELRQEADARREVLNLDGVARLLNVSTKTVRRWIKAGRLPCVRLSTDKTYRFIRSDVLKALRHGLPKRGTPRLHSKPHAPTARDVGRKAV